MSFQLVRENRVQIDAGALAEEIGRARASLLSHGVLSREEQTELAAQLAVIERQAAALHHARHDFLAIVSHELRTPLTSVLGFLELVVTGSVSDPEDRSECVAGALESARELHRVVNDILEMAELEAGDAIFAAQPFEMLSVLRREVRAHAPRAAEKGVALTLEEPSTLLPGMVGDEKKVQRIARHLLSNAVKFTPAGEIHVRTGRANSPDLVRVEVADTGVGFPPEIADLLAAPFHQAEGHLTRSFGGMGLGLAVVVRLLQGMGGSLEIRSNGVGKGTSASFTIPLAPRTPAAGAPRTGRHRETELLPA